MKKIMLMIAFTAITLSVNAQFYLGGGIEFSSIWSDTPGVNTENTLVLSPEFGYRFNKNVSLGCTLMFIDDKEHIISKTFGIEPYTRCTFEKWNRISLFGEVALAYTNTDLEEYHLHQFAFAMGPGLSVELTEHFSILTRLGLLNITYIKPDYEDADATTLFNFNLKGTDLSLALQYTF